MSSLLTRHYPLYGTLAGAFGLGIGHAVVGAGLLYGTGSAVDFLGGSFSPHFTVAAIALVRFCTGAFWGSILGRSTARAIVAFRKDRVRDARDNLVLTGGVTLIAQGILLFLLLRLMLTGTAGPVGSPGLDNAKWVGYYLLSNLPLQASAMILGVGLFLRSAAESVQVTENLMKMSVCR